jgi:deazaflavin-dependent oxidoreductase (nitroreductase family)
MLAKPGPTKEKTVADPSTRFRKPGPIMRRVTNPFLVAAMRTGISVRGSRVLEVKGRTTGTPRRTPVNLLQFEGHEYLVSPRGDSQWARNVRADNGQLVLELGRRREPRTARELPDDEKPPVLRAYLRKWKMEIGMFFQGVGPDSSDEELLQIAPKHPVFVLSDSQS